LFRVAFGTVVDANGLNKYVARDKCPWCSGSSENWLHLLQ